MKLLLALLLLASVAVCYVPSAAADDCIDGPRSGNLAAVLGVVVAGAVATYGTPLSCATAHSPTQVLQWTGEYHGPGFLVAPTFTWATAVVGCTASAITAVNSNNAGGSHSIAAATITMTSTECRGTFSFLVTATAGGLVASFPSLFTVNIRVEQPNYSYWCAATGTTANAYAPGTQTCQQPTVAVAQSGDWTVTLDPITGTIALTGIPDTQAELLVIADAIRALQNQTLMFNGTANVNNTSNFSTEIIEAVTLFTPILIFVALVIWAEITGEFLLYVTCWVLNGVLLVGLWPGITNTVRTVLVLVNLFLILRIWQCDRSMGLVPKRNQEE